MSHKTETTSPCPKCNARDSIPIAYGYPGPEMMEASRAGKIELGGCIVFPNQPNRSCRVCHHRWREASVKPFWEQLMGEN